MMSVSMNSIGLSGMQAASMRMANSAHNVANMNTPGFQPGRVIDEATPTGGVKSKAADAPQPRQSDLANRTHTLPSESLTKPSMEIVQQMLANQAFKASAEVVKAGMEQDAVLDLLV